MADKKGLRAWLLAHRSSSRLAFILQVSLRILGNAMALLWIRLLVPAMGKPLNSLFLQFQNVFSLGGLGDLGMGGAIGIRAGHYLGEGKAREEEFRKFLASARSVFLLLALVIGAGILLLSPWLPSLPGFKDAPGAGPLPYTFMIGSAMVASVLLSSYISNLNYGCGNVLWPMVPTFVLLQITLLCHWLLARLHQPLWVQFLPYLFSSLLTIYLTWFYVRTSHPPLARILPLSFDWPVAVTLFESSFWIYLCTLGNSIYNKTDAWVISAGFPLGTLTDYNYNYKFCEIAVVLALTASYVTLPKITQWMASSDPKDQERLRVEMRRLNQFQSLLGCGAALAYLAGNDLFMKVWWLHSKDPIHPAALPIELAFALNVAVTTSGDAGIQLALRSGQRGLRFAGGAIALTGLVNLGLSILAMKMQLLWGVAGATVVAQSALSLVASYYICRHLQLAWLPWALKGWLFPLAGISLAGWLRNVWPVDSVQHFLLLVAAYLAIFIAGAWALGVDLAFIREEMKLVRKVIGK